LRAAQQFRKVGLAKPSTKPDLTKQALEASLLGGEEALLHCVELNQT